MNPHEILELNAGASAEEVQKAYQRLARKWHPDRHTGVEKQEAEIIFHRLTYAFNVLMHSRPPAASGSPVPVTMLERAPGQLESSLDRQPDEWFHDAKAALAAGERARAFSLVQIALRGDSSKAEYHIVYSDLLLEIMGDFRQAMKSLEMALSLKPDNVDAMIKLARYCQSRGMHTRASGLLTRAREIKPNHGFFRQEARRAAAVLGSRKGFGDQIRSLVMGFLHPK